jgi:hypothetical protein
VNVKDPEAFELVALLRAAYPDQMFPEESAKLYARFLRDFPIEPARRAVEALIANGKFRGIPRIADVRRAVIETAEPFPSPEEAWIEVHRMIARVGGHGTPSWSSPVVGSAVAAFGWIDLCQSENVVADRAHFFRIYEACRDREVERRNVGSFTKSVPLVDAAAARAKLGPAPVGDVVDGVVERVKERQGR